ncbi:MAG TPA: glycosyltransferase family 39 protein [Candidatus Polarisedimenticolia bacterium]|nr:glycosyltransferase family 39 protein [Candidatus Polarisedimenticolia bacterium]
MGNWRGLGEASSLSMPNQDGAAKVATERDRILPILLAAGFLLRLALAWAPFSYLAERGPLIDDAFYSFSIARNLAAGHGPTADGIHETSGFQPLYTFALVPLYAVSSPGSPLPIHLALTLLALAGAASGWFVYRIARRVATRRGALFATLLWCASPYFLSQGTNGLETGLFGLCFLAALDFHLGHARPDPSHRNLALLGLLLGVTVLARVDGVLLAVAIAADFLLRRVSIASRLRQVGLVAAVALATVSPYVAFLVSRFGVLLPESGKAVRNLSLFYGTTFVLGPRQAYYFPPDQVPFIYYVGSLRKAVQVLLGQPLLFPVSLPLSLGSGTVFSPQSMILVFAGGALLALNLLFLKRPAGAGDDAWKGFAHVGLFCALLWLPAYAFGVLGQWWFERYLFPLFILMSLASAPALERLSTGWAPLRRWGSSRVAFLAAALQLAFFAGQVPGHFIHHRPYENVSEYMKAARALDEALAPGSRGGAFQSGTIGYFARHPVINLDGVVNGNAAAALREQRISDYIREEGIEALIDWPQWISALLIRRSPAGTPPLGPARRVGGFVLIRVEASANQTASVDPHPPAPSPARPRTLLRHPGVLFLAATLLPPSFAAIHAAAREGPLVVGLDHIPVAVRDLEAAGRRYRRLGFVLKQGRPHANGIRNLHAKFADGSEIELITADQPRDELSGEYRRLLYEGEGPAFVALYAPDPEALTHRIVAVGKAYGRSEGLLTFPPSDPLRYLFFGSRNKSPTDRPEHFEHPNGAEALIGVWLAAENFTRERALLAALNVPVSEQEVRVPEPASVPVGKLREGEILFLPGSRRILPGRSIMGATVRVRDLDMVRRALTEGGISPDSLVQPPSGRSLLLPPEVALGMWLEFRVEPASHP